MLNLRKLTTSTKPQQVEGAGLSPFYVPSISHVYASNVAVVCNHYQFRQCCNRQCKVPQLQQTMQGAPVTTDNARCPSYNNANVWVVTSKARCPSYNRQCKVPQLQQTMQGAPITTDNANVWVITNSARCPSYNRQCKVPQLQQTEQGAPVTTDNANV